MSPKLRPGPFEAALCLLVYAAITVAVVAFFWKTWPFSILLLIIIALS